MTYARQLWLLQWAQHLNPHAILQIENPRGAIERHPLSRRCVLLAYDEGGLGCSCAYLSNCMFPSARDAGQVAPEAAAPRCNPMCRRLQPHVLEAASPTPPRLPRLPPRCTRSTRSL